jgi:hypothetical protein
MLGENRHIIRILILALLFLLYFNKTGAQIRKLEIAFQTKEFELKKGDVISNVLRIVNTGESTDSFSISIDYPAGWKLLFNTDLLYTCKPSDTLYIPVRIVPLGKGSGNSRYMISAFAASTDDLDLGQDIFWAFTKKSVSWKTSTEPAGIVYFRNREDEAKFSVNIINTGTELQPIMYSINNMSLQSAIVDSTGKPIKKTAQIIQLNSFEDTTFFYTFKYMQGRRNFAMIDIENYRPDNAKEEKSYNLIINSEEPNFGQPGSFNTSSRLQFKKLSDEKRAERQTYSDLPFIIDYNVSNLLDQISFTNINIRGQSNIGPDQSLIYNMQANAIGNNYSELFRNNNYYIGYFHPKGNLQAGYLNGAYIGLQSFGRGLKGTYNINSRNAVNSFYVVNQDRKGTVILNSYGIGHSFKYYKNNLIHLEYGKADNKLNGTASTVLNTRITYSFFRTHSINAMYSNSWNNIDNKIQGKTNNYGYFLLANYNAAILRNKLSYEHSFGQNTRDYANAGVSRVFYNHRSRYFINGNWSVMLSNNYNQSKAMVARMDNTSVINRLSFIRAFKTQSVQPILFYNRMNTFLLNYEVVGGGINYNYFDPKDNTRLSTTVEAGNNIPSSDTRFKSNQFLMWNTLFFYRTLTVNCRYIIGNFGITEQSAAIANRVTPQTLTTSFQHQYVFPNTKFMLQTAGNYFYNNIFKQHNASLNPDIYMFTRDGWRFRVGATIGITSSMALSNFYNPSLSVSGDEERITNQSIFITLGVRKEFSTPIPFKKSRFTKCQVVAFYDVNGNGILDKRERPVENVVVIINDDEVLTNADGEATIVGAEIGVNKWRVFSLEPVTGWFPNISDTLLISKNKTALVPFVKGVRVKGKVSIDREAIAVDKDELFDLSSIKITAVNHNKTISSLTSVDGTFEFFLPYGDYIISMDEGVLGNRFKLAKNNYELSITKESDGLYLSFLIIEKKRKINKKIFEQNNGNKK